MTNKLNVSELDVDKLVPNSWNTNVVSPENLEKIKASLNKFGMFRPVVVREHEGKFQIIGGQHRWQVAKQLGYTKIPAVNLGKIDEKTAKEIGLVDNGRYGEDDVLALGELLKELGDAEEIMSYMPFNDSELDSIFSASSIMLDEIGNDDTDIELPELVSSAKAVQTHQIMRFKVPMEDAEFVQKLIETTMRTQGFTEDDSLANAGNALVHLLKAIK